MKIFVLLFDGVGIRNFAYSGFFRFAVEQGHQVIFWNGTEFPVNEKLGLPELKLPAPEPHKFAGLAKDIKQKAEIKYHYKKTKDKAYLTAIRKNLKNLDPKQRLKHYFTGFVSGLFASHKGRLFLERRLQKTARSTPYYQAVLKQLDKHKPDIILSSHQRPVQALEPVLAAQDLGIPTAGFIFSWDNLPKATLQIKTDYYLVWSEYMKNELLYYYPEIRTEQIFITGTPQFEIHYQTELKMPREDFFKWIGLPPERKYIVFSGDDVRTSPNDDIYLSHLCKAVRKYNSEKKENVHIIFRPVPVDFSSRYEWVEEDYTDVLTRVQPLWQKIDDNWTNYFPTPDDGKMLTNLAEHTEGVFNIGSSMVFDFVAHEKPTVYFNYETDLTKDVNWWAKDIYNLIHFRSMPSSRAVLWAREKSGLTGILDKILMKNYDLSETKKWFDIINTPPQDKASERIIRSLEKIVGT